MKSTPARMLRNGQLIIDADGSSVHKIISEPNHLPENTVSVQLRNQITGEESRRNLRWDQHVTTEEPLEVKIGETGKISVELAHLSGHEGRPQYRYKITDEAAGIDHEAADVYLDVGGKPDSIKAADTLMNFLIAGAEAWDAEMQGRESDNAGIWPPKIERWAFEHGQEILTAAMDLSAGLEAGR
jgi:hypothetical protein